VGGDAVLADQLGLLLRVFAVALGAADAVLVSALRGVNADHGLAVHVHQAEGELFGGRALDAGNLLGGDGYCHLIGLRTGRGRAGCFLAGVGRPFVFPLPLWYHSRIKRAKEIGGARRNIFAMLRNRMDEKRRPGRPPTGRRYEERLMVYTDQEGRRLLEGLRKRLGVNSDAEVVRRAIQEMAKREGVE
jgi:hypothetical protein